VHPVRHLPLRLSAQARGNARQHGEAL
jgi:hypothetical protein